MPSGKADITVILRVWIGNNRDRLGPRVLDHVFATGTAVCIDGLIKKKVVPHPRPNGRRTIWPGAPMNNADGRGHTLIVFIDRSWMRCAEPLATDIAMSHYQLGFTPKQRRSDADRRRHKHNSVLCR
jgi:hypothetical protein